MASASEIAEHLRCLGVVLPVEGAEEGADGGCLASVDALAVALVDNGLDDVTLLPELDEEDVCAIGIPESACEYVLKAFRGELKVCCQICVPTYTHTHTHTHIHTQQNTHEFTAPHIIVRCCHIHSLALWVPSSHVQGQVCVF